MKHLFFWLTALICLALLVLALLWLFAPYPKPAEPISAKSGQVETPTETSGIVYTCYSKEYMDSLHTEVDSLKAEVRKWKRFFVEHKQMKENLREENAKLKEEGRKK